jgi:hypothetical protein
MVQYGEKVQVKLTDPAVKFIKAPKSPYQSRVEDRRNGSAEPPGPVVVSAGGGNVNPGFVSQTQKILKGKNRVAGV